MGRQDYETETMVAHSLRGEGFDASEDGTGRGTPLVPVLAFDSKETNTLCSVEHTGTLTTGGDNGKAGGRIAICKDYAVRRLTPVECERLQAFPDNFTRIPYRGKPADNCPDGPRYKALGNSMAVNVMAYIGERIQLVEDME